MSKISLLIVAFNKASFRLHYINHTIK